MTLKELIEDGLKRHGYDGLFNPDVCACKIGDLAPCGGDMGGCEPGVFTEGPCSNCCGGKLCDFHIGHGMPNAQISGGTPSAGWASDIIGEVGGELEVVIDRLARRLDGEALQAAKRALAALQPILSEPTITTLAHLDVPNDKARFSGKAR